MHLALLLFLSLFVAQADEGIGIDPFGYRIESGVTIDPEGAQVSADDTSHLDPNGGAQADAGLRIDDNG